MKEEDFVLLISFHLPLLFLPLQTRWYSCVLQFYGIWSHKIVWIYCFVALSLLAEYANIRNIFLILRARRNREGILVREWNI